MNAAMSGAVVLGLVFAPPADRSFGGEGASHTAGAGPTAQSPAASGEGSLRTKEAQSVAQSPVEPATSAKPGAEGGSVNALGVDLLLRYLGARPDRNAVLSPFAVQQALSLLEYGARGQTQKEFADVFHWRGSTDACRKSWSEILREVTAETELSRRPGIRLGISIQAAKAGGVAVDGVEKGGLADVAGILAGDRIVSISSHAINGLGDWQPAVEGAGDTVAFRVVAIDGRVRDIVVVRPRPVAPFVTANRVWIQKGANVDPNYVAGVDALYASAVRSAEFKRNPEAARQIINSWVAGKTDDRIPELLPPGAVEASTRLAVGSAICFTGQWARPFNPTGTRSLPFRVPGELLAPAVPTMAATRSIPFAQREGIEFIELSYKGGDVAMLVALPPPDLAIDVAAERCTRAAAGLAEMIPELIDVQLPRFSISCRTDLKPLLVGMGLRLAFSASADFSGIGSDPLQIDVAQHDAVVTIDEAGTKAIGAASLTLHPFARNRPFNVDRPFLFVIRHRPSGAWVFVGWVNDPRR